MLPRVPTCDHIVFRVADMERSLSFYTHVLPAELVSRKQHADRWRTEVAVLRPSGQPGFTLVLILAHRVRWLLRLFHACVPRQARSLEHVGFVCATLPELEERERLARSLGTRVTSRVTRLDDREGWVLEVLDPDGNAIEWTFGRVHD